MAQQEPVFGGCGMCGALVFNGRKATVELDTMVKSLRHRGPDSNGTWVSPNNQVFLGHTRLSIIDLSNNGHQPMMRKTSVLTYNGEIYNFQETKDILLKDGCEFQSTSDTEVLLFAYLKWGTKVLERLNGFFSFAIWDESLQSLFVAVDRLGVKPLYYQKNDNVFCFASEVETMIQSGVVEPIVDKDVVLSMCCISHALQDLNKTPVKDVFSLTPGHYIEVNLSGDMKVTKYWDLPEKDPSLKDLTVAEASAMLKTLVDDSLRLRMISDVPVCTFLSGGIDSSIITAIASSYSPVSSFCVSYGARNSDNEYSEIVAQHLGDRIKFAPVDVRLEEVQLEEIEQSIDMATIQADERTLSVYRNYKAIADNNFKVVLNGQGADEILAGYAFSNGFREHFFDVQNPEKQFDDRLISMLGGVDLSAVNKLSTEATTRIKEYLVNRCEKYAAYQHDSLEKASRYLTQSTLRAWFRHEDFLSMKHSVECRVPFSDHRIVEFCFKIPFHLHIDTETQRGKVLLREVAIHYLPKSVVERPKQNFPFGDTDLLKVGLKKILTKNYEAICQDEVVRFVYCWESLETLLAWDHTDLWTLVNLWLWHRKLQSYAKKSLTDF